MKDIGEVDMRTVDQFLAEQAKLEQKIRHAANAQAARDAIRSHRERRMWNRLLLAAAVLTFLALAVEAVMGR